MYGFRDRAWGLRIGALNREGNLTNIGDLWLIVFHERYLMYVNGQFKSRFGTRMLGALSILAC